MSDLLLEKETIDLKQIVSVLGERPFEAKENYKAYLEEVNFKFLTFNSFRKKSRKKKKLNKQRKKLPQLKNYFQFR